MTTRQHSPVGPSSLYRIRLCPGSLAACAAMPPRAAGQAARLGTAVHALIEECLRNGEYDASSYVGTDWAQDDEGPIILTQRDVAGAQLCLDHVWPLIEAADEYHVEVRLEMPDIDPEFFGTSDLIIINGGQKHVVDYKNGVIHVNETGNEQLLSYALGALKKFPHAGASSVTLTVVQPNSLAQGVPARTVEYSIIELFEFAMDAADWINAARQPDAPRIPGEKQCQWCDARATCPALAKVVTDAHERFDFGVTDFASLSADELGERYALVKLLSIWHRAVDAYVKERAAGGQLPTGFKAVSRPGIRQWSASDSVVLSAIAERFKTDIDALIERKAPSPATIERAIGRAQMPMLADLITKSSGWTLAPLDDKREALPLSSLSEKSKQGFEVVED